jgi:hypothetical protein
VKRIQQHDKGRDIMELHGKVYKYNTQFPFFGPLAMARLYILMAKFELTMRRVNPSEAHASSDAQKHDAMTLQG